MDICKGRFILMSENNDIKLSIEKSAKDTANQIQILGKKRPASMIRKLQRELENIRVAYKRLIYSKQGITKAYEWLYDNYYILDREGRIVIKALSELEDLPYSATERVPASYCHAQAFCKVCCGKIDATNIEKYIEAAQTIRNFESLELASFGLMLRAALIEGAAEACGDIEEDKRELLLSDAVKTLNFLTTFDFSEIVERLSRIEQILSQDPAGIYNKMEERTRTLYRKRVSEIANHRKISESDAALLAVSLAKTGKTMRERHVGHYLIDNDLDRPRSTKRGAIYLTLIWLLPALLSIGTSIILENAIIAPLIFLPVWEITKPLIEYFMLKNVPATFLPRLELDGVIPEEAQTLVVISTLLTSPQKITEYANKLEQFYYSNGRGNISFAVLADLKETHLPEQPEDSAIISASVKAIKKLNSKYGQHFYIFIRSRRLVMTQGNFAGWERKRGAIVELIRLIKGQYTSISTIEGDYVRLSSFKYVIALDSDTGLLMDAAAEMVSVAMHPLNCPEIDREKGIVTKGFGILAPRISVDLFSAGVTSFSRVMAGNGGVTAYDNAAVDTYQDLFGEGIFAGKGLINVDAFFEVLDNALPENHILSHDILEGCFMRSAFLSDVELTDGFPSRPGQWFDRLHRWIRGDWQNISYIGSYIRKSDGKKKTPFNAVSRFKMFDNLRRSIMPVFSMACLVVAAFLPLPASITLITVAFLSIAGQGLWSALLAVVYGGPSMLSRKYHCKVLPQAINSIAQSILGYLFLPYHTAVACDAIVRALWRNHTGKRLLEWVTSAETESRKGGVSAFWRFWYVAITGLAFVLAAPSPAAKIAGAFFIITPFVAWLSGHTVPQVNNGLSDDDKETLRSYIASMWRYYEDYALVEDNFLPPDNVQEAPVHAVAHRTSPTNIGLMLLSTLAARDFGLIDSENLLERIERTLSTIEKLEKWKGHLLNWYDTKTLKPLHPAYVSTVDSGNLLCCLTALCEGLRDYTGETSFTSVIVRIKKLIDNTELTILYNKRRKLFHIGYDVEKNELSEIYYDLLMSEARMTSYYAIAKRDAPKRHWGALGRTLTKQNGYTGPVSWTGTMFEYMMPHLLLPVYEDSLSAEALRFVIYCHKHRVKDHSIPWGISESGFYAFDAALNYQYEAHGVQKLALKRGMDNELVISPYSTFIALPFDPTACMKNLKKLEDMDMYGFCGFYEAADFTYKRTEGHMSIIKSYMAHHVGMSIVAASNALLGGIMQERFMRNYQMRSAKDLLQEKIPANAVVFNDVLLREIPGKPGRNQFVREVFDDVSPVTPRIHTSSNGEYTMVITDTGASFSMFRGIDLFRRSIDLLKNPLGIYTVAKFENEVICTTSAPEFLNEHTVSRSTEFNSSGAVFSAKTASSEITMHSVLHGQMPCEARHIKLENFTQKPLATTLLVYFEPVLSKTQDEAAHPAFSRLFLSASYRADAKILMFARRPRGTEMPAFLAIGFAELELDFEFELDRTKLLHRPEGIASLNSALSADFECKTGAVPDAAVAMRLNFTIEAHSKKTATLLLVAANSANEAAARLIEARREGFHEILRGAAGKDSNEIESRLSALILPQILFPVKDGGNISELKAKNRLGQPGLWSLGISGDFPIILFEYSTKTDTERLKPYIKTHRALRLKGIQVDLVIAFREGGDYSRTQLGSIKDLVKISGSTYLIDSRAGVHIINLSHNTEEIYTLLQAIACHIAASGSKQVFEPYNAVRMLPASPAQVTEKAIKEVYAGRFTENSFVITHKDNGPPAPWCHLIVNKTFGTMVSDRALGFTWAVNSRENKLTPWLNDTVADNRGEMLIIKSGTRYYDLCANAVVSYKKDSATYESIINNFKCLVKVSVPGRLQAKLVELLIENTGGKPVEIDCAYYIEPVLGVGTLTKRHIYISQRDKVVLMRNPWATVSGIGFLSELSGTAHFLGGRADFFAGRWEKEEFNQNPDVCAALVVHRKIQPGRSEKIKFALGWGGCEDAALKTVELLKSDESQHLNKNINFSDDYIKIKTPDKAFDILVSDYLSPQIISSRIMGRTGFYQCGGAWGFRDQLQDCCAALILNPDIAKSHIYRCAAHQFKEGDAMHWWHQLPPRDGGARGVRTRCSDDFLWLPYTVCEFIEKTGDYKIFEPQIYYLNGPELEAHEEDRYFSPVRSNEKENVYLHCLRAIERAKTNGPHGLPLFGCGDWNDGMNLVGINGTGESVWLAMFLALVLERFAPICRYMHDNDRAQQYEETAQRLKKAVDYICWDGEWYLRGFYDDGAKLGSRESGECIIDVLPQCFAVIANLPDTQRRKKALDSMLSLLADEKLGILKLFIPPFDGGGRNPGYIRSYPPGIRENGGQYTHAAVWAALALFIEGRSDEAYKLLSWINPILRTEQKENALTYRLEPYAVTADIYSNKSFEGRGGWSQYTGAAGWYYRTAIEYMLGIKIRSDRIVVEPSLPTQWDGFEADILLRGTKISIKVTKEGEKGLNVDGKTSEFIPLDGKEHSALLII